MICDLWCRQSRVDGWQKKREILQEVGQKRGKNLGFPVEAIVGERKAIIHQQFRLK